ncbi:MAG TPA: hypothetical protein QGF58_19365 [Myxococcota bacterium]|nr:hypothetical protein [Myxococcota bacterium]
MPLILLACVKTPIELGPPVEAVQQFKLESPFGTLAGVAVVSLDEVFVLQALTPAGVALFTVEGDEVSAPDEGWAETLELIPFSRDMHLVYRWSCPQRCEVEGGMVRQRLTEEGIERRYRGQGGPATVVVTDGEAVLEDPRRRYTLTVLSEAIVAH